MFVVSCFIHMEFAHRALRKDILFPTVFVSSALFLDLLHMHGIHSDGVCIGGPYCLFSMGVEFKCGCIAICLSPSANMKWRSLL